MIKDRIVPLALVAALACSTVFIGGENVKAAEPEVWSAYSTVKVLQSKHDYVKGDAVIDVSLAKGETEAGQLVITAADDIKSYELKVGELKTADGVVFDPAGIDVEVQRYVEVLQKTAKQNNEAFPTGWTPDMLMPMSTAVEYGLNTVGGGMNQGLTVEFTTNSQTKAGVYTGEFTLVIDGKNQKIPVSVEVWNYDITKCYGQSVLLLEMNNMFAGELSNTDEIYKSYYDTFLNKYKSCAGYIPNSYDLSLFVQTLDEYWDNPNFTTYIIPAKSDVTDWYIDAVSLYDYVYELASKSTPDRLYLERAVYQPVDEPLMTDDNMDRISTMKVQIEEVRLSVWERLCREGFFEKYGGENGDFAVALKDSLNFTVYITSSDLSHWGDLIETYCPPIQYYETAKQRAEFKEHAEAGGYAQWFYTCMQPIYPYPSHHIDDYLIGSRVMRWMQKDYDLDGYLFWCINQYTGTGSGEGTTIIDPYTNAGRFWQNSGTYNGDGFMFYPGAKYGSDTPFGSLRLDSLRDGQEDYNALCVYDGILTELSTYYGVDAAFDAREVTSDYYNRLYSGTVYYSDDGKFFNVREDLSNRIVYADGEYKFHYVNQGDGKIEFYAANGVELKVNGKKLSGEVCGRGFKYGYEYDAKTGEKMTVEAILNGKTETVLNKHILAEYSVTANELKLSETLSDGTVSSVDANKYRVDLNTQSAGNAVEQLKFKPFVKFGTGIFGSDFKTVDEISFDITCLNCNAGDVEISVSFDNGKSLILERYLLEKNKTVTVSIAGIIETLKSQTGNVVSLNINFKNKKTNADMADICEIVIEDFNVKRGDGE